MRELELVPLGARSDLDEAFARSLRSCYGAHGVATAATPLPQSQREQVQLVVVRDARGALCGGARIHAKRGMSGFPAERALAAFPQLYMRFAALARNGSVELAAMWTVPEAKRTGVARLLAQAAMATAITLGKRTVLTFSHQHFEHVLFPIGMRPLRGVAPVAFPTAAYRSRVYTAELSSLRDATSEDRDLIREIAARFSAGAAAVSLHQLAEIEFGQPSLTIRTGGAPLRRAVS